MLRSAQELRFEEAARLRDCVQRLESVLHEAVIPRRAPDDRMREQGKEHRRFSLRATQAVRARSE